MDAAFSAVEVLFRLHVGLQDFVQFSLSFKCERMLTVFVLYEQSVALRRTKHRFMVNKA